ncbi:MAG: class I SAM-dependent methyltransferase [Wenzhouxiangellaceae bacterium]
MLVEQLARTPEPELMDSIDQVTAYAEADFSSANQWLVDDLLERFQPRPERGRLIDLGCGPGDICMRVARALPEWQIEGLDAGANMLARARADLRAAGLTERIALHHARMPDTGLEPDVYNCILSNSLLHHLPDPMILWHTVSRLAAAGAWIQIMDLDRPENAESADRLVDEYAADAPEVLRDDFRNSLHAAWRADEVREQLRRARLNLSCRRVSDRHWLVSGPLV